MSEQSSENEPTRTLSELVEHRLSEGRRLDARAFFSVRNQPFRDDFSHASEHRVPSLSCLDSLNWSFVSAEPSISQEKARTRPADAETGIEARLRFSTHCSPPLSSSFSFSSSNQKRKRTFLFLFHAALSSYFFPFSARTRETREFLRLEGKSRGEQERKGANFRKWKNRISNACFFVFFSRESEKARVSEQSFFPPFSPLNLH